MLIVGICADMQHGKDTVARMMIELAAEHNVIAARRAMADPLKEEIAECFAPMLNTTREELLRQMNTTGEKERWRLVMQWWGTEFRRTEDTQYWVKRMYDWVTAFQGGIVCIPDIRFQNEIDLVKHFSGYMIRVNRPGFPADDAHASEQEWKQFNGWDQVIENDGTEEELKNKLVAVYTLLEGRGQF